MDASDSHNAEAEKGRPKRRMITGRGVVYTLLLLLLLGGAGGGYYLYALQPALFHDIRLKLDRLGVTPDSPQEIQRVNTINKLPITYEEKQVLINRTIFMGATPQMVMLALGKPKEGRRSYDKRSGQHSIIFIYHLPQDLRPTILKFQENKLVEARKGSTLEYK